MLKLRSHHVGSLNTKITPISWLYYMRGENLAALVWEPGTTVNSTVYKTKFFWIKFRISHACKWLVSAMIKAAGSKRDHRIVRNSVTISLRKSSFAFLVSHALIQLHYHSICMSHKMPNSSSNRCESEIIRFKTEGFSSGRFFRLRKTKLLERKNVYWKLSENTPGSILCNLSQWNEYVPCWR